MTGLPVDALVDVVAVTARPDFSLLLVFENGDTRLFDMVPLLGRKPFHRLAAAPVFLMARVQDGTVMWPGAIDIAPETPLNDSVLTIGNLGSLPPLGGAPGEGDAPVEP